MIKDVDFTQLEGKTFTRGSHESQTQGMCVMEAVCWLVYGDERWTDLPPCVPSEIAKLAQRINDMSWPSDEARTDALRPLIQKMLRAVHGDDARRKRGYLAAHFAAQRAADTMDRIKLTDQSAALRTIPKPTTSDECQALSRKCQEVRRSIFDAGVDVVAVVAVDAAAEAAAAAADDAVATDAVVSAAAVAASRSSEARLEIRHGALLWLLEQYCDVVV